jgi:D-alanyl-D-alanine carboxypeptidase (penicillin-binding protein 5/6)
MKKTSYPPTANTMIFCSLQLNKVRHILLMMLLFCLLICNNKVAYSFETIAAQACIMDYGTGEILYEKNGDELMAPSSMSKLMTTYMVFNFLKDGSIALDNNFIVSQKAWKTEGSKMFVQYNSAVSVEDLIRGMIVQSGNDACIVLAEGISGDEALFAEQMNIMAKKLGLEQSRFQNATGWPDPNHVMTARELAILAARLIRDFPEYYHYFAEQQFSYNGIRQMNRNVLLNQFGVDGLKTGHTNVAGYGIVASAQRNGRRVIVVINGLKSEKDRAMEASRLLNYSFTNFDSKKLFSAGEVIEQAPVWYGSVRTVGIAVDKDIEVVLPKLLKEKIDTRIKHQTPLTAPIEKGQHIADLIISYPNSKERIVPLVAKESVQQAAWYQRIYQNVLHYLGLGE